MPVVALVSVISELWLHDLASYKKPQRGHAVAASVPVVGLVSVISQALSPLISERQSVHAVAASLC